MDKDFEKAVKLLEEAQHMLLRTTLPYDAEHPFVDAVTSVTAKIEEVIGEVYNLPPF